MKSRIKIILFIVLVSVSACGQKKKTKLDIDSISVSEITHKTRTKDLNEIFGKSISYKKIEDMDGEYGDTPAVYEYLKFTGISISTVKYDYMFESKISDIEIKDSIHSLKINKKSIKVADDIDKIKKLLPYEYEDFFQRIKNLKKDKVYELIGGNITLKNHEPTNIVFEFKNEKISKISVGFPR